MTMLSWIYLATIVVCFAIDGMDAIIANGGTKGNSSDPSLVSFTTEKPLRSHSQSDKSPGGRSAESPGQLNAEESVKRQAVYDTAHHYSDVHHNELSYGGRYDYSYEGGNNLEGDYHHLQAHHHYPDHGHHIQDHGHYYHAHKALALKGLLIPLAGVALLGAAAAFVSNPILLQLGVITGKKRRRRSSAASLSLDEAESVQQQLNDLVVLERFIAQLPKDQAVAQEKQLLATYLSCSGSAFANGTVCLERVTCELHRADSVASELEKHVMAIVTSEILKNEYVPEQVKEKIRNSAARGLQTGNCSDFPCKGLEAEEN